MSVAELPQLVIAEVNGKMAGNFLGNCRCARANYEYFSLDSVFPTCVQYDWIKFHLSTSHMRNKLLVSV